MKNVAIAANWSRSLKASVATEALSESINKAALVFNSLKTTLLEIYCSPIKRAVGSFIRDFKHLTATN